MPEEFVISDTHFYHANIIKHCNRPFPTAEAMNEHMVSAWNRVVAPADTVWFLGDFCMKCSPAQAQGMLERLNGTKHLIVGNHDHPKIVDLPGWASVRERLVYGAVYMDHYPVDDWPGKDMCIVHLHGHSHGQSRRIARRYDVGVDTNDFTPVKLRDIISSLQREKVHGDEPNNRPAG
jgi:calcineurin-like phosphoesterase family protein